MIRIIDNKKVDLTDDEFNMYQNICKSYTKERFDGKDLFKNLFETDDDGIIIFLKPPEKVFTLEVVCFLQNIMIHQHLRRVYKEHQEALEELKTELNKLKK